MFETTSRQIAKEFLQTAVVVDDGLYSKALEDTLPPAEINDPTELPANEAVIGDVENAPTTNAYKRTLDADAVMEGFFKEEIICATIRPTQERPIGSADYLALLKKADLVVLDWNLVDDNGTDDAGQQAKEIIKSLVARQEGGTRFRVIVVYTGGTELATADQEIVELLAGEGFDSGGDIHRRDHTVIAVYAKEGGIVDGVDEGRQFGEAELGSKCVDIFAEATRGFLSNAVLKGMALIRGESHKLLNRFSEKCDPAFLFHRMLTSPPSDVEDQVIPLIVAEIEAILFELRASESVRLDMAQEYLDYRSRTEKLATIALANNKDSVMDALNSALKDGLENDSVIQKIKQLNPEIYSVQGGKDQFDLKKSDLFCQTLSGAVDLDSDSLEELAMLMSLQQSYGRLPPILGPGSILQEDDRYWLCVQPACDSVRVSGNRVFPFLKMTQPQGDRFDYIIKKPDSSRVKLRVDKRLYSGTMVKFKPSDGFVQGTLEGTQFVFSSVPEPVVGATKGTAPNTRKFTFVAQLKVLHSLREADRMTNELGRIGLTESEWSRRASTGG